MLLQNWVSNVVSSYVKLTVLLIYINDQQFIKHIDLSNDWEMVGLKI